MLILEKRIYGNWELKLVARDAGQNEFLSTIVMMKSLISILSLNDIFKIAIYIEATIPFRTRDNQKLSCFDKNRPLLSKTAERYSIDINEKELDELVLSAVLFANKDVENFGDDNPAKFLDNTWRLLPETNPALRFQNCYTIGEYRISLQKMLFFLQNLKTGSVFQQFKGYPNDTNYTRMVQNSELNILIARSYISIELLTVGILESIAISTGGDVPLCYFMGALDIYSDKKEITSLQLLEFAGNDLIGVLINALCHMVPFREKELLQLIKQEKSKVI